MKERHGIDIDILCILSMESTCGSVLFLDLTAYVNVVSICIRVRTIPNKAPNFQYPTILASSDTNTQYQYRYYCVA